MTRTPLPLAALLLLPLAAEAAVPTVESAAPAVGQRGTEFTLTLTGARLTGAEELLIYEPGVVCTRLTVASPSEVTASLRWRIRGAHRRQEEGRRPGVSLPP